MSFLSELPRVWVSIGVPGTSPQTLAATYVGYSSDQVPLPPPDVDGLDWLERAARHPEDFMAKVSPDAVRDISAEGVADLAGGDAAVPADLARFLRGDGLRDRLRSATDSYFDLGDASVAVDGGRLVHLISDSQWVFHWLIYIGDDGSSAVVGTSFPAGFDLEDDGEDVGGGFWGPEDGGYVLVAESFGEFIWRWWMDNEIFYRAVVEKSEMTPEDEAYVRQYGLPAILG